MDIPLTAFPASHALPPVPAAPDLEASGFVGEAEREAAFEEDFFWQGRALHGLSIERYSVFVSQRAAMGAPALSTALRDGNAFYPDAVRILWLCSAESSEISSLRRDPEAMQREMDAWAAAAAPLPLAARACETAIAIFNAAHENRHEVRHTAIDSAAAPSGN